jgi:hypothetical protein
MRLDASATIRTMLSGGALLIALFLQSAIAAPGVPAEATSTSTKARLDLRGPADCVSRGDLAARVAARSPRIQFVDDAGIHADVALTSARPGNVVAELVLATPGAEQPPRRFAARSCAEAADAIALIIAVTLDPTLKRTGGTDRVAASNEKPVDQSATDTAAAKPPAPAATVDAVAPPAAVSGASSRRHFGISVAGQTIFGPAPAVMPGIAISGMAALNRDGVWSPALFVGATHVWRDDLAETGGTASFTLDAATVDVCPLRVGGWFAARPCVAALVGRLSASGTNTEQASSAARPFATAGVALTASAGTIVEVAARVGVGVTLLRDSYEFGGATFHRASTITTTASLGVGLHWP